jgi:tetratricopeptide (TPR) repeat protein
MTSKGGWVFLIPIASFLVGSGLFIRNESTARISFERAQEQWRLGEIEQSLLLYSKLREEYPQSEYSVQALWEIATVCYYNLYDLNKAIFYFEELIQQYPQSEYATESRLKLADIYDLELNDTEKSLDYLLAIQQESLTPSKADNIQFQIAEAYFKLEDFDSAFQYFRPLTQKSVDIHLTQRAMLRLGAILQIQKNHTDSIEYLERVMNETTCPDCRLQAQLGLIESYELVDRIGEAIEIAEKIDGDRSQSEDIQRLLLNRLLEKRKHYEPQMWSDR